MPDDAQKEIADARRQMEEFARGLTAIAQQSMQAIEARVASMRSEFTETLARVILEKDAALQSVSTTLQSPQNVAMCIRYRNKNDGDPTDHRLEYTYHATATDPVTGLDWPDAAWNAVLNGYAVEVTL